jgi:hypothetical protein
MDKTDEEILKDIMEFLDNNTDHYVYKENLVNIIREIIEDLWEAEERLSDIGDLSGYNRI